MDPFKGFLIAATTFIDSDTEVLVGEFVPNEDNKLYTQSACHGTVTYCNCNIVHRVFFEGDVSSMD